MMNGIAVGGIWGLMFRGGVAGLDGCEDDSVARRFFYLVGWRARERKDVIMAEGRELLDLESGKGLASPWVRGRMWVLISKGR